MTIEFLSQAWADAAKEAFNAEPDAEYRAGKLDLYWDWIEVAGRGFEGSLALGSRDDGRFVLLRFERGTCTQGRTSDGLPEEATFALTGTLADWAAVAGGYNANRAVMYRKLRLDQGEVFAFFDRVYFFTEGLAAVAKIPTAFPQPVG